MRVHKKKRSGNVERREILMMTLRREVESTDLRSGIFEKQHEVRAAANLARGELLTVGPSLTHAGGLSEEVVLVQAKLEAVDNEILNTEVSTEHLLEQLLSREIELGRREKIAQSCRKIIEKIVRWSAENNIDIQHVKKLGGGFVNIVLMFTTPEGESFVVKAFVDKEQAQVTRDAQHMLCTLAERDEVFVPETLAWVDDSTLISESVEGKPIRSLLATAHESLKDKKEAIAVFESLGRTLGSIHERTEELVVGMHAPEENRMDVKKILRDIGWSVKSGLFDFSEENVQKIKEKIRSMTAGGYISMIHGDAHLDQFFRVEDSSVVTIVDTDTVHLGDPMADVARALSSMRDWGHRTQVPERLIREMESALMRGYRSARVENGIGPEPKFSQQRILLYELRLSLIQLWGFNEFRDRIRPHLTTSEPAFYRRVLNERVSDEELSRLHLSQEDKVMLENLVIFWQTATEIISFINEMED